MKRDTKEVIQMIDEIITTNDPNPQPEPATPETPVPFSPRSMEPVPPYMPDPETPPEG